METTTCKECNDRGIVHIEVFTGLWGITQCNCMPSEHWAAQSDQRITDLKERLEEAQKIFGGEIGGEMEHTG